MLSWQVAAPLLGVHTIIPTSASVKGTFVILCAFSSKKRENFPDILIIISRVAWLIGWALILEYTIGGSAVARGISPNLVRVFPFLCICTLGLYTSLYSYWYDPTSTSSCGPFFCTITWACLQLILGLISLFFVSI